MRILRGLVISILIVSVMCESEGIVGNEYKFYNKTQNFTLKINVIP